MFCPINRLNVRVLSGTASNKRAESKAYKKTDCETSQSRQYCACAFFQRHRNGFWSTAQIGQHC
jgi:hypothetical protein